MRRTCLEIDVPEVWEQWQRGVLLGATALALAAAAHGEIVFDNTQSPVTNNHFKIRGGIEIGDQIGLNYQAPVAVTNFVFEYYGTNFSGNEQLRLRFYQPSSNGTALVALLFDSGWVGLPPAPEGAAMQYTNFTTGVAVPLTRKLPAEFTWSVEFQGVEANEEAGLLISVPMPGPRLVMIVANPYAHERPGSVAFMDFFYWQKINGQWMMLLAVDENQMRIPINFRARIEGEAESSHFLPPVLKAEGQVEVTLLGAIGRRYRIESSADLVEWSEVTTGIAENRVLAVTAPISGDSRFYRAVVMEE